MSVVLAAIVATGIATVVAIAHTTGTTDVEQPPPIRSASPFAPASHGSCGQITVVGSTTAYLTSDSPLDAETCFATAFSKCRGAELVVYTQGVDTGETDRLTVEHSRSGCRIADHDSWFMNTSHTHHKTSYCTAAAIGRDGLALECQSGAWTIAAPANIPHYVETRAPIPPSTGIVGEIDVAECPSSPPGASPYPCRTYSTQDKTVVITRHQAQMATVRDGLDGKYRVPLAPGVYTVTLADSPATPAQQVTVAAAHVTTVDFVVQCSASC